MEQVYIEMLPDRAKAASHEAAIKKIRAGEKSTKRKSERGVKEGGREEGSRLSLFYRQLLSHNSNHSGKLIAIRELIFYSPDHVTHGTIFDMFKVFADFHQRQTTMLSGKVYRNVAGKIPQWSLQQNVIVVRHEAKSSHTATEKFRRVL